MHLGNVQNDAPSAPVGGFNSRAGQPGGAQVLNAADAAGIQRLQTRLDEDFLQERVTHLHRGAKFLLLLKGAGGQAGGAMNPIPPGIGAHQEQDAAGLAGGSGGQFIGGYQADAHSVYQGIMRIGLVKVYLAGHIGNADAVAVPGDTLHHTAKQVAVVSRILRRIQGAKAEGVEQGDGAGAHGEDVADDAADSGGRPLQRLHCRRMVMGLYLEYHRQAVANVHRPGVFGPRLGQYPGGTAGEEAEQGTGVFIAAMFAP